MCVCVCVCVCVCIKKNFVHFSTIKETHLVSILQCFLSLKQKSIQKKELGTIFNIPKIKIKNSRNKLKTYQFLGKQTERKIKYELKKKVT